MMAALDALPAFPTVSVILAAFNAEEFIEDAVESLLQSTYPHWECIIVDDGSTDRTGVLATRATRRDTRFRLVTKPNGGHTSAIHRGATEVSGQLVAFLDSDDVFLAHKLELAVASLRAEPDAGLLVHRLYIGDRWLRIAGVMPLRGHMPHGDLSARLLSTRSGDPGLGVTSGMVLRRELFDFVFHADLRVAHYPDELIRRIAPLAAPVTALNEPLGIRRTHGGNRSDEVRADLGSFVSRAISSYELIHEEQERRAALIGRELPATDLDLELLRATRARLERSTQAGGRWSGVMRSRSLRQLSPPRRWFWVFAFRLPRFAFAPVVRSVYGVSNAKLLLNHAALVRLRRKGTISRRSGLPELSLLGVFGRAFAPRRPGERRAV
jgi:glycosyltransferase involved in cell wall biosynthesis